MKRAYTLQWDGAGIYRPTRVSDGGLWFPAGIWRWGRDDNAVAGVYLRSLKQAVSMAAIFSL